MRTVAELRGSSASLRVAANRSSIVAFLSRATALSLARRPEYCFASLVRRLFFSIELVFAIKVSMFPRLRTPESSSLPEREIEGREQGAGLLVVLRRRADDDVQPQDRFRLVVVDLGENDVFLDAHRVVAAPVEALRVQPAEVAHARQRDVDQA